MFNTRSVRRLLFALLLLCSGSLLAAPESGWWWNPAENGRGFSLEVQGSTLFIAGYLYGADGTPTWVSAGGPMSSEHAFDADLMRFEGGQTLTGDYRAPAQAVPVGRISLRFTNATSGFLTWPGGTIPIERFRFGSAVSGAAFESGWWWNANENGRGYFIENQGDSVFVATYMYDDSANPVWYSSYGAVDGGVALQASLRRFSGGQGMTQPYAGPPDNEEIGGVTLRFQSHTQASLTLPGGRTVPITRFVFGDPRPSWQGVTTGNSPDQNRFVAARGYPHAFAIMFASENEVDGRRVPLDPPRRFETWLYNNAQLTLARFDNGFFDREEVITGHMEMQATSLRPQDFWFDMTEAQVLAHMGQPSCIETDSLDGRSYRFLRYKPSGGRTIASVGFVDGKLVGVVAGMAAAFSSATTSASPADLMCSN